MSEPRETIVLKYGSNSVANEEGIRTQRLDQYARQIGELYYQDYNVIVVSSGAVMAGRAASKIIRGRGCNKELSEATLATIGSLPVFNAWSERLKTRNILTSPLLVTHREIDDPEEGGMLRATLKDNIDARVVSVVNENDALSDRELAALSYGGDNDGLAAHIARITWASHLCLMTEVDGLQDENQETVSKVPVGEAFEHWALQLASGEPGAHGRGGMASKVQAAIEARANGIEAHIALALVPINEVLTGQRGTHFPVQ